MIMKTKQVLKLNECDLTELLNLISRFNLDSISKINRN